MKWEFDFDKYNFRSEHRTDGHHVLVIMEKPDTAEQWIEDMISKLHCDEHVCVRSCGEYVYVSDDKGNTSHAVDNWHGTKDQNFGAAVAYAHLKGIPLHRDIIGQ